MARSCFFLYASVKTPQLSAKNKLRVQLMCSACRQVTPLRFDHVARLRMCAAVLGFIARAGRGWCGTSIVARAWREVHQDLDRGVRATVFVPKKSELDCKWQGQGRWGWAAANPFELCLGFQSCTAPLSWHWCFEAHIQGPVSNRFLFDQGLGPSSMIGRLAGDEEGLPGFAALLDASCNTRLAQFELEDIWGCFVSIWIHLDPFGCCSKFGFTDASRVPWFHQFWAIVAKAWLL